MADPRKGKVMEVFRANDRSGNGKLSFKEFHDLIKSLNPAFKEEQTEFVFTCCDKDLSGELDIEEFVDYTFGNDVTMRELLRLEKTAAEEEAKGTLLSTPLQSRSAASQAVFKRGQLWKDLTWIERLEEVRILEKHSSEETTDRKVGCPAKDPSSTFSSARISMSPKRFLSPEGSASPPKDRARTASCKAAGGMFLSGLIGGIEAMPKGIPHSKFAVADMNQKDLVDYSLQADDLEFAGSNTQVLDELNEFKEYLRTAGSPLDVVDIDRFIAKGTAGWVFLTKEKESGAKNAMKLIRMTQARSAIKEWYVSKVLRAKGVENVVFTDPTVYVLERATAPAVIEHELKTAGPVPYYMCMIQQLMPWGTLEDLAKEGELSPEIMFTCLEDVAQTLAVMHANGLQHKDIKPENIMLQMDGTSVVAAKICDFGSAEIGENPKGCQDDMRRFGVTLFSVATGEGWTKNRLIHESHDNLVKRLADAVEECDDEAMKSLPGVLKQILDYSLSMEQIAAVMAKLGDACA